MVRRLVRQAFGLLLAGAALFVAAGPIAAQVSRCAPHADMTFALSETFAEKQHAYGLLGPLAILEVFVSDKGSWTIIVTGSNRISCVLAVGVGWETLPEMTGTNTKAGG